MISHCALSLTQGHNPFSCHTDIIVTGTSGIIWFIFWILLVSDFPATHPRISRVERLYIESTLSNEEQVCVCALPLI